MENQSSYNFSHIVFITFGASIGGFLFGFDTAVINGATAAIKNALNASDSELGLIVSLTLIAAAFGAFFGGILAHRLGRLPCMFLSAGLFILSSIGSALHFGVYDFILWRLIAGVGIGIVSVVVPIYLAELAPAHIRGRMIAFHQLAIIAGIFFATLANYFILHILGSDWTQIAGLDLWKGILCLEALPAIVYLIAALFLPESPCYLLQKNREKKAFSTLSQIDESTAETRFYSIKNSLTKQVASFGASLGAQKTPYVLIAGLGLAIFQQLVGINVIFYYGNLLWSSVGFDGNDSLLTSLITGGISIFMSIVAIVLVDSIGRKPLLLIGSVGMSITLAALGFCFGFDGKMGEGTSFLALICANLYVAFFAATWGPVMWVMLGEMFSNQIRALAIAVCGVAQWLANFAVSWSFPVLSGSGGIGVGATYFIYAACAFASFIFVMVFVRENKGKELEEM